jgi:hypothetical protein
MLESYVRDWQADRPRLERDYGIVLPDARAYLPDHLKADFGGAQDAIAAMDAAQPTLTTTASGGIPAMLTTFIDPDILTILFAANKAARILGADGTGERKKGDWTDLVAMFPVVENTAAPGPWGTSGVVTASPNEVYADIQSLFYQLVLQTDGLIELDQESKLVLAMSPTSQVALTAVNSFNVDVFDILKKNFPNMRFETAVQYGSALNGQGGNLVQMWAEDVEGQNTGYCAFTEKLRSHQLIRLLSAWAQKMSQGTWGAIIRQPFAVAQMLGV